jgi:hypothetical protein
MCKHNIHISDLGTSKSGHQKPCQDFFNQKRENREKEQGRRGELEKRRN